SLGRGARRLRRDPRLALPPARLECLPDPLERQLPVAELGTVLSRDADDARGPVRHAHGGLGLVAMLPARPGGAGGLPGAVLEELSHLLGKSHGAQATTRRSVSARPTACGFAACTSRLRKCTSHRSPSSPRSASCSSPPACCT